MLFRYPKIYKIEPTTQGSICHISIYSVQLRSMFASLLRENIIENLGEGHCFLTADFAQKWDPQFHLEEQSQYYGKRGLAWHVIHSLCKMEGKYVQHMWIHLIKTGEQVVVTLCFIFSMPPIQDSVVVTNMIEDVLMDLKLMDITRVHIRSDNAGTSLIIIFKN